jgi:hypothetical protein
MTLLVVAARPVSGDEASLVLEWEAARLDLAAGELMGRGVLIRTVGGLSVSHDLVRSAIEKEVPADSIRSMHGRIADFLQSTRSDDLQAMTEALTHRRAGRLPSGRLALALAGSPRRRLLGPDLLRELETIADEGQHDENGVELDLAVASLAAELQQFEAALRRYSTVWERLKIGRTKARAALGAARAAFELRRGGESWWWLGEARSTSNDDVLLEVEADLHEATLLRWTGHDPRRSHDLSSGALVAARRIIGSEDVGNEDERNRIYVMALRAEFDEAFQSSDVDGSLSITTEMAAAKGDEAQRLSADISNSLLMLESGRVRSAMERFERARVQAQQNVLARRGRGRLLCELLQSLSLPLCRGL